MSSAAAAVGGQFSSTIEGRRGRAFFAEAHVAPSFHVEAEVEMMIARQEDDDSGGGLGDRSLMDVVEPVDDDFDDDCGRSLIDATLSVEGGRTTSSIPL